MPTAVVSTANTHAPIERRRSSFGRGGLTHSGIDVARYTSMHVLGALFPVAGGSHVLWLAGDADNVDRRRLDGGRRAVWKNVGRRGEQLRIDHSMWFALLLALTLPPHLLSSVDPAGRTMTAAWPILPAAGLALSCFIWVLGGSGAGRIHPVLVVQLLLIVLFQDLLVPHYTLQRNNLFAGDVLNATLPAQDDLSPIARRGIDSLEASSHPAMWSEPAARRLENFTTGFSAPQRNWTSLESLLRDDMPPLESLIIGGQPSSIGSASIIAVIIGGLFLLYRGLIDYRIPLLIFAAAFIGMLVLPIPIMITEDTEQWRWFAMHSPAVGQALAITFADYEMMASPLVFMAFFLATAPSIRPMTRRARTVYAILIGLVRGSVSAVCVSVDRGRIWRCSPSA